MNRFSLKDNGIMRYLLYMLHAFSLKEVSENSEKKIWTPELLNLNLNAVTHMKVFYKPIRNGACLYYTLNINIVKLLFFISMLLLASCISKGPKITFDKPLQNFIINKDDSILLKFSFKNTGDEPLVIKNVSAECGCTTTSYPKETIAPTKNAEISVMFNSGGLPTGATTRTVVVETNTKPMLTTLSIIGLVKEN